jgi:hypothetical protein
MFLIFRRRFEIDPSDALDFQQPPASQNPAYRGASPALGSILSQPSEILIDRNAEWVLKSFSIPTPGG